MPSYLAKPAYPILRPAPPVRSLLIALPMVGKGTTVRDHSGNGRHGTISGGSWNSGVWGPVRSHTSTSDRVDFGDCSPWLPTSGGFTAVLAQRRRTATVFNAATFGINDSVTATRLGALVPWQDGVVYWDFGSNRLSKSGLTFGDDVWAFTTGPRGMEIWQNGQLVASNATNATRTSTATAWKLGTHSGVPSDLVDYSCFLAFGEQLPEGTVRALSADPFLLFRRPGLGWLEAATAPAPAAGAYKVWYAGAGRGSMLGGGTL